MKFWTCHQDTYGHCSLAWYLLWVVGSAVSPGVIFSGEFCQNDDYEATEAKDFDDMPPTVIKGLRGLKKIWLVVTGTMEFD